MLLALIAEWTRERRRARLTIKSKKPSGGGYSTAKDLKMKRKEKCRVRSKLYPVYLMGLAIIVVLFILNRLLG